MTPDQFRQRIRRALPYKNIVVQCDDATTPEHLAKSGLVCAIVTYCPNIDPETGAVIEDGFFPPGDDAGG